MKRTDNRALADSLLDHCMFVNLSMTAPDGNPYCVPIQPVRVGDALYFHCARRGRKIDAMRAHPRVCVTCVGKAEVIPGRFDTSFQSLIAFGTAEEVTEQEAKIETLRHICEKYCPDDLWDLPRVLEQYLPATGIWRITLREITTKG